MPDGCANLCRGGPIAGTAPREEAYLLLELAKPWPAKLKRLPEVKAFIKALDRALDGRAEKPKVLATPKLEWLEDSSPERALLIRWNGEAAVAQPVRPDPKAVASALSGPPRGERISLYLVCTHGSRDRCCGTLGYPVYKALEEASQRKVLQVSHLGGHRYAPLALAMPEWRFFGHLSAERAREMDLALSRGESFSQGYRGNGRLDKQLQVVEAEVWKIHGSSLKSVKATRRGDSSITVQALLADGSRHNYEAKVGTREIRGYKSCEDLDKGKKKTITLPCLNDLVAADSPPIQAQN